MIESGVVFTDIGPAYWHLPKGRTAGSIPDSRDLWDVLWALKRVAVLGFAHTHPGSGVPGPSHTDITTFAAVELGLGRRVAWLIASSDHVVRVEWEGPGKHDYKTFPVEVSPWIWRLRRCSEEEEDGSERSTSEHHVQG